MPLKSEGRSRHYDQEFEKFAITVIWERLEMRAEHIIG
jgi:hypothetical protein